MGRFQKRSFFCENETIVFENDRLTNQKTIVKRSFSKTINNPMYNLMGCRPLILSRFKYWTHHNSEFEISPSGYDDKEI